MMIGREGIIPCVFLVQVLGVPATSLCVPVRNPQSILESVEGVVRQEDLRE